MLFPLALPRRYLVGFDPRELPHHFTDVLIIGGGIAGIRAALGVPDDYRALVVTKDEVRESNSHYAQGGIAGVLDPEDRFDNHIADTLTAGKGLCEPEVVEMVVREAPDRINELIGWGTHFDQVNGQVSLGLEGGHSHARIAHALGDETGREIMRAIILQARSRRSIRIWQNCSTIDLLTHEGRCRGVLVWDKRRGFALVWRGPLSWPPVERGSFTARRPIHQSPRPMATRWPTARGSSCATWSSCNFIRPCSTWPALRGIS